MGREAIDQLVYLMDAAFEGDMAHPTQRWHAVLANLASVRPDDWRWVPPGGARTIAQLVGELGACKYVYDSHAFGDGSIRWDQPASIPMPPPKPSAEDAIEWLRGAHATLRGHVAALQDNADLRGMRPGPWHDGPKYELRWLVNTMIQHDLYHAGEINHLRALHQGTDGDQD